MRSKASKNSTQNAPTKDQADFRENLRALHPNSVTHHIFGSTAQAKINLISENIGHWAIIAVTPNEHTAIHAHGDRRALEKSIFDQQMRGYNIYYDSLPFSEDIFKAIMERR